MPNFSQFTGCGHLGKDAESRAAGSSNVVSFSVAVTRKRKDAETVTWFRCNWFGDRAMKVKRWLTKGKAIIVTGELYEREYEKDGAKRKSLEVDVHDVVLLGGRDDGKADSPAPATSRPSAPAGPADDSDPPF